MDDAGRKAAKEKQASLTVIIERRRTEEKARQDAEARKRAAEQKKKDAHEAARLATQRKAHLAAQRRRIEAEKAAAAAAARRRQAEERHRQELLQRNRARERLPLWRMVGSGAALAAGGIFYLRALDIAGQMPPSEVVDDVSRAEYRDLQSDARLWQGLAIGSTVVATGLAAWAAWAWFGPQDASAGSPRTTLLLGPIDGEGISCALHLRF